MIQFPPSVTPVPPIAEAHTVTLNSGVRAQLEAKQVGDVTSSAKALQRKQKDNQQGEEQDEDAGMEKRAISFEEERYAKKEERRRERDERRKLKKPRLLAYDRRLDDDIRQGDNVDIKV